MKGWLTACTFLLGGIPALFAGSGPPADLSTLTSLTAVHALSNADAARHLPVAVEATVTYYRSYTRELFVQDSGVAVFVFLTRNTTLSPGDRVLVRGITQPSFHPIIESSDIAVLYHGMLPRPVPKTYQELVHAQHDGERVTVEAVIRSSDLINSHNVRSTYLHMLADGGAIDASVESDDAAPLKDLLDPRVEITGVIAAKFDSKMQQTGIMIHANRLDDIWVRSRASTNPWTLAATPMDAVFAAYQVNDLTSRLRVRGTITYYEPGTAVVLQNGPTSLWVATEINTPLTLGNRADATGFPDVHDGFLKLERAEVRDTGIAAPVVPQPEDWQSLSSSDNVVKGHIFDLVSIEGQIVTEAREATQDEYILSANGRLFTAIYHHSDKASLIPLGPMKQVPPGSRVRVTGICIQLSSNPWNGPVPFNILLRSFDDIALVASPSPLNVRNLVLAVTFLLAVVIVVGTWGWALKVKVAAQTGKLAAMAEFEQNRSRTLEDINGARPLHDILREITNMVSTTLKGAPCWCQIAESEPVGNRPPEGHGLRVISTDIGSRQGPAAGVLLAGLNPLGPLGATETDALSEGARLASLAIETRRHYSDLQHRSDYDLLTGTHNRFSFHRHLTARLAEAAQSQAIVGLVYIDLDEFKKVNDLFGHHIGDKYLQEAALRMKHQLRSFDVLGRLGGDEFAALLPVVRSRADAAEIALRLERCFDEPFNLEGYVIQGSTSVGFAVFPEEATSADKLLSVADSAMYAAKFNKRRIDAQIAAELPSPYFGS